MVGLLSGLFSITVCSWPSVPYEPLAGTIAMMSGSVKERMMMTADLVLTDSTADLWRLVFSDVILLSFTTINKASKGLEGKLKDYSSLFFLNEDNL